MLLIQKMKRTVFVIVKKILGKIKFYCKKRIYLSLGENCLADNILERYNLKSFSTPYSSGRSNIEYILYFEKTKFADFLNQDYLVEEYFRDKPVVRNKRIVDVENNYSSYCINGFEFTHHDVRNPEIKTIIDKRCQRMMKLRHKNIVFLYHHRLCPTTNLELLIKHVDELNSIYRNRRNKVNTFVFMQQIVDRDDLRRVERFSRDGIHIYTFFTTVEWEGKDPDVFWARCDEDLIEPMIDDVVNVFRKKNLLCELSKDT